MVPFVCSSDCNCELDVTHLVSDDVGGIPQMVSQEEKGRGVFLKWVSRGLKRYSLVELTKAPFSKQCISIL